MGSSETDVKHVLYLPSTPLNLLLSVAQACLNRSKQRSKLVLIDQNITENNPYFEILKSWPASPFDEVLISSGSAQGLQKLAERKMNFSQLAQLIKTFSADAVAVGSDRRVEFQYVMHVLSQQSPEVEGWYLDDGLYSYAGRPQKWIKDAVNSWLKKLSYGSWWQEPSTVGASNWVHQAWLFQPNHAVEALKSKQVHKIESDWFSSSEVRGFSEAVCNQFGMGEHELAELQDVSVFMLIPHPNNIKKMTGYESRLQAFMSQLKTKGVRVAAKYHPRTEQADPLDLVEKYQAVLVPAGLAFEFVLPNLKEGATVVGDVGTALLTAQWLRPDLDVYAVLSAEDDFQESFKGIYQQLGVNTVENFDAVKT